MDNLSVSMWKEEVIIPTYEVGEPENNPMFFEKRVYQGSSGAVYPNKIIEKIFDERKDKSYEAIFLENRYIKIMLLPQLGGRIQMAFDKIGNRHFIYYNEVIKPALVGLCGPWISGGIEFNWPQHHRPSTFEPLDFSLSENEDGSKTVWIHEIEKMTHTRCLVGFTLYADKAYIEIKARLFNRSSFPQSFLWWANPAVHVNDQYQSVFPPDVHAVYDHGRRDLSDFPIAKGVYYKVNYAPGTDISRYKNIPVPTSYMAVNSEYDFVGGYEHDTNGGLLHIAGHHVSPGKKQWTWGNGDFGKAWDRNLTDNNGPYIELMTGVFTDNQPDFAWILPNEEKNFTQYFLPYRELGLIKNANKDLALHFSKEGSLATIKVFATSAFAHLKIDVLCHENVVGSFVFDCAPENIFIQQFSIVENINEKDCKLFIYDANGSLLLSYAAKEVQEQALPEAAKAPASPKETATNELLYLTGLHLEQYRHATYNPVDYYEEALRREAGDIRCNNALGLLYLRRGQIEQSEAYFRKAIETLTRFNPNPYNGEPYYNLGLCLQLQECFEDAYDNFYKASWNSALQSNSFFALAQIDVLQNHLHIALEHINQSLHRNAGNTKAIALKSAILRRLNRLDDAFACCEEGLRQDQFNLPLYFERGLLYKMQSKLKEATEEMQHAFSLARGESYVFIEFAIDFMYAGLFAEAKEWLEYVHQHNSSDSKKMLLYYLGYISKKAGKEKESDLYFKAALVAEADGAFPNRIEDIKVLQTALNHNPGDYQAYFLLGCLWYDKRNYSAAIESWQRAIEGNQNFAPAYRTLGIAYYNKLGQPQNALEFYEKAYSINEEDARILMELDQLKRRLNHAPKHRLHFLEDHLPQVLWRDDLYLERIAICNQLGEYEKAYELIMSHQFHPWEGGEGKVPAQYKLSLIQVAKKRIENQRYEQAIGYLQQAQIYPENLGEGKLYGTPENEIFYWLGCAYEGLHQYEEALNYFKKAIVGVAQPSAAIFYNDPQPDSIFYQGLSWEKLGEEEKAKATFTELINYGEAHLNDKIKIDFFAVSLPDLLIFDDDLDKRNALHCQYMMALGYLGLKKYAKAKTLFMEVLSADSMHAGAQVHLHLIPVYETKE